MMKKGAWFSAVKKAFNFESKEQKEEKSRRPGKWFGKQRSTYLDSSSAETPVVVVPAPEAAAANPNPPIEEVKLKEAENEQNRQAYSVALATAMAAEAAVAAAQTAAEVVRLRAAATSNMGKTKEEIAAIKIQTAFRGYLARRALKALRGFVRLKSLVKGKSLKRQAAATLKSMQKIARLQTEIRARRIKTSQEISAIQQQIQEKHEKEKELQKSRVSQIGANWDDSVQSKQQIEAKVHNKQEASMRRERALAYAYSHQQTKRYYSNPANQTFMDPNNPRWGWSWLDRWMAGSSWESQNTTLNKNPNNDPVSSKNTKIQSPTPQKPSRPPNKQSPSTPKSKVQAKIRQLSLNGREDDSTSMNSTHSCKRHSCASSLRDDESFASSRSVPSYMLSTQSARAKSRSRAPLGMPEKVSPSGSAKKRLSFAESPGGGIQRRFVP